MKMRIIFFLLLSVKGLTAQSLDTLGRERYLMAEKLKWRNISKHVFNEHISPRWKSDNSGVWFIEDFTDGYRYCMIDFNDMIKRYVFDHKVISEQLNEQFDLETNPYGLGLVDLNFLSDKIITFIINGEKYRYDLGTQAITKKEIEKVNELEAASPDGKWIAYTKNYNLYIKQRDRDEEIQLSTAGRKHHEYASRYGWFDKMEGENGDRPERLSVQWSPDSKRIFCNIVDTEHASKMYMLDNSIDSLYRPKLLSYYRGSPGDTNIVYYKPVVFDIEKREEHKIEIDPVPHFTGIYPTWGNEGKKLFITHWDRGFKRVSISEYDLNEGYLKEIYSETSDIGIEFSSFVPYYSSEHDAFFFTSEKSGWKQLYRLDIDSGKVIPLTKGAYFIDEVIHVNEEDGLIYFTAAGREHDHPYHNYLYQVGIDGQQLEQLTTEKGHHEISMSPDGKYFVDNFSSFDQPTRTYLYDSALENNRLQLSQANTKYLDSLGWQPPQAFKIKANDDKTDIYGVIYKPTDFDAKKTYPILDATYTGPHTSRFPRSYFSTLRSNSPAFAELGFVVIQVDGRGSNRRSKAFRSYSYKNLGGGLDDHVTAIKTLSKKYVWLDTTRVGIFGHSAGGYDVGRALLAYGDLYKVGVASSGDHDHRMEKAWWPEMYMGWPVDEIYHTQSNITNAKNLKGKLLLVHGALDDNVNISATMKLSEALIRANKEFDLLVFPSQRHGYYGRYADYFAKKRWNYFVEHLLGKVPRWDY